MPRTIINAFETTLFTIALLYWRKYEITKEMYKILDKKKLIIFYINLK